MIDPGIESKDIQTEASGGNSDAASWHRMTQGRDQRRRMNGRSQRGWILKQKKILHLPERGGALAIDEALRRCDAAEKYLFGRLDKIQERSF